MEPPFPLPSPEPRLPLELVDEIIDACHGDMPTLYALSLVSARVSRRTRTHIFDSIHTTLSDDVHPEDNEISDDQSERDALLIHRPVVPHFRRFTALLDSNPSIGKSVRELAIEDGSIDLEQFFPILQVLSNLRSLSFKSVKLLQTSFGRTAATSLYIDQSTLR